MENTTKITIEKRLRTEQPQAKADGLNIPCLVSRKGQLSLMFWDIHHICFNDSYDDDYECDLADVDFWFDVSEVENA